MFSLFFDGQTFHKHVRPKYSRFVLCILFNNWCILLNIKFIKTLWPGGLHTICFLFDDCSILI